VGEIEARLTDPKEAQMFVKKTRVDFLAVSIGSAHGIAKSENLDIELLKRIRERVKIPLVLHGGSGVPDEQIREAIQNGICKINIDTDIRFRFAEALDIQKAKHPEEQDPRKIMGYVIEELQKLIEEKIKLFGSDNKA
jgi:fructose-bisphosphate aldolase class II